MVMSRYPTGAPYALAVLHSIHRGTHELALVGDDWPELAKVYWRRLRPHIVLAGSAGDERRVPLLTDRFVSGTTQAYLCSGFSCLAPVTSADELEESLAIV
jgi:uncharacterized protein YyaL (SSP411 family)